MILFALNSERDYSEKINIDELLLRNTFLNFGMVPQLMRVSCEGNFVFTYCGVRNFISTPSKLK